ncbi:LexA family protein [Streptomyces sp. NPDC052236]|uniref:LexA family protein n=1 Tax=Streptomyces sp. NPDC052236 TaxID=3365686 RepID=UPI0037D6E71C
MNHLTERQERILACIREWIADHGQAPSVREIGRCVGLSSPSSVAYQLKRLEQRGAITRSGRTGAPAASGSPSAAAVPPLTGAAPSPPSSPSVSGKGGEQGKSARPEHSPQHLTCTYGSSYVR